MTPRLIKEYVTDVTTAVPMDGEAATAACCAPNSNEMANVISESNFFMKLYLGC